MLGFPATLDFYRLLRYAMLPPASGSLHRLLPLLRVLWLYLSPVNCLTPMYTSEPSSQAPSIRHIPQAKFLCCLLSNHAIPLSFEVLTLIVIKCLTGLLWNACLSCQAGCLPVAGAHVYLARQAISLCGMVHSTRNICLQISKSLDFCHDIIHSIDWLSGTLLKVTYNPVVLELSQIPN